jgi:predicted unusual protein kinase regulating ubiquinone biosynthesis (AarF/ABC1/UbiB family)
MNSKILFLFKSIFSFLIEYCIYFFYNDYSSFIDKLTNRLASVNILYIKIFQAIALNNDFIDAKINNKLLQFTDNAPWSNEDINFELLTKISNECNLVFKSGFEKPINAGMISLVYKAHKRENDEPVIVKIKRVNIEKKLFHAINNLLYCVDMLSFLPYFKKYKIQYIVHKSMEILEEQTNFKTEVDNMIRIKNNCKNLEYVKIPFVYKNITDENDDVIVMEYYQEFAKQIMKFGFVTTIIHGFTHGDLHSGNILFIKDISSEYPHKIAILDFGIMYDIENSYKDILFQIFTDLFTLTPTEIAEKILLSGIVEPINIIKSLPIHHYNNIIIFTSKIIEKTICSNKANQKQIYRFLHDFFNYLNNNQLSDLGLFPSDDFVKTQMCIAMAHGVTLTLCDDSVTMADQVLQELFHIDLLT